MFSHVKMVTGLEGRCSLFLQIMDLSGEKAKQVLSPESGQEMQSRYTSPPMPPSLMLSHVTCGSRPEGSLSTSSYAPPNARTICDIISFLNPPCVKLQNVELKSWSNNRRPSLTVDLLIPRQSNSIDHYPGY